MVSATRLKSLSWVLLVGFAGIATALAGEKNWGVAQLHAGTQLRGQIKTAFEGQPAPADLAMAFQTVAAAEPGASSELWRDAVADSSPAVVRAQPAGQ
jgi:hypothetical protein